jgi:hypothetical protein
MMNMAAHFQSFPTVVGPALIPLFQRW